MSVKTIVHESGKTFRFGRRRPVARCPRLSLKNYLFKSLPEPPADVDYSAKAAVPLSQVYLNDQLGDCVIAGMEHIIGVLTGNADSPIIFADSNTTWLYEQIGGYVPGKPDTDNGCDEQTALNFWQQKGATPDGSHKIAGWVAVDASNADEIKTALWLFENLVFGVELPDAWVNSMPNGSGFTWDVAGNADPENGHCFCGFGYSDSGVTIDTWAMLGVITWLAIAKYAGGEGGELYAVLSEDAINKATQKAPSGFDFTQLSADLDAIKS